MSALDHLLNSPDLFSLFGLERRFDVDPALLQPRYAELRRQVESFVRGDDVATSAKASTVLRKLEGARLTLSDPVTRGAYLLELSGGGGDPRTGGRPPGFRQKLERWAADAAALADEMRRERDRLLGLAARLFGALGSADNGVVQRHRRQQIRDALDAVSDIDHLLRRAEPNPIR